MEALHQDFAIVIGIAKYRSLPLLDGPANDVRLFTSWLSDPQGGNLPAESISLLIDPLRSQVHHAFTSLGERIARGGARRLYIYATGHGFSVANGGVALVMTDASPENLEESVDVVAYADAVRLSGAFDEIILFVDCDRSHIERSWGLRPPPEFDTVSTRSTSAYYALAAVAGGYAYESSAASNEDSASRVGDFTRAVVEGLRGAAAGAQGQVDQETLTRYVRQRLRASGHGEPEFRVFGSVSIVFVGSASASINSDSIQDIASSPPERDLLQQGPSTHITSDVWTVEDALGYGAYAYAIYRFMTHPQTRPPLTISIQAPWGGGKTSLMRMIQKRLDPNSGKVREAPREKCRKLTVQETLDEIDRWSGSSEEMTSAPVESKSSTQRESHPEIPAAQPPQALPRVPPDSSRELLTIWFNAWKYESTREVWAGLVDAIMHQVAARLPLHDRELFWLRLNLKRVDPDRIRQRVYDRVFRYWWRWMRWVTVGAVVSFLASILLIFTSVPIAGWTVAGLTTAITTVTGVWRFLSKDNDVKSEPASVSFAEYLDVPDYAKELGFIHNVEADLRRVLDTLPLHEDSNSGNRVRKPIVIFIDDLDRCSPAKVAQVIEAVNLFLAGDFPNCMFVIGMDTEMVAAALQAAHKDLVSALPSDVGIPVGWRFMDKFVQLPFTIPPTQDGGVDRYTASLFVAPDAEPTLMAPVRADLRVSAERVNTRQEALDDANTIVARYGLGDQDASYLRNQLESAAVQRTLSKGIDTFSDRDPEFRRLLAPGMAYFRGNPRELKRFVNAFRFNYFLWWAQRSQGLPAPRLEQLIRWTVLTMRWPEVVRWLRRSGGTERASAAASPPDTVLPTRLMLMEATSARSLDVLSWQREAASALRLTLRDAPWLRDDDLLAFFADEATLPVGERLSSGSGLGMW